MNIGFAKIQATINAGLFLLLATSVASGQGCSDAGFCTMGAMKPNQHFPRKMRAHLVSAEIAQYAGYTKFHTTVLTYYADLNISLGSKTGIQLKLPYTFIFGELANTKGVSDISLSASRNLIANEKYQINITAGAKIPTNKADLRSSDGRPLPMYYQTSLGTYDIIFGGSLISKKWLFAAGYQQALNTVDNNFLWGAWKSSVETEHANLYPLSKQLKRGNDIMLRVERNFRSARFNTYIGLLPIYRIKRDEITAPVTGIRTKINGSDGLTLNLLTGFGYRFSTRSALRVVFGVSVIRRKLNPDGLSRQAVNSISYEIRF
jgi:hypothetical protein